MGRRSPLVTLAATGAGLLALLVANSTLTNTNSYSGAAPPTPTPTPIATTTSTTPSPTPTPARTTPAHQVAGVFAGRTTGRGAALAIAIKDGRSVAYLCDGRRVESWLTGTQTAGQLALRSKTGDTLTGTLAGASVIGAVIVRGRQQTFTIRRAGPPAGLYRAKTSGSTIGWIILPDGSQVGIDDDGTPAPAPPFDPQTGAATVGGTAVTATSITGDETL